MNAEKSFYFSSALLGALCGLYKFYIMDWIHPLPDLIVQHNHIGRRMTSDMRPTGANVPVDPASSISRHWDKYPGRSF